MKQQLHFAAILWVGYYDRQTCGVTRGVVYLFFDLFLNAKSVCCYWKGILKLIMLVSCYYVSDAIKVLLLCLQCVLLFQGAGIESEIIARPKKKKKRKVFIDEEELDEKDEVFASL